MSATLYSNFLIPLYMVSIPNFISEGMTTGGTSFLTIRLPGIFSTCPFFNPSLENGFKLRIATSVVPYNLAME